MMDYCELTGRQVANLPTELENYGFQWLPGGVTRQEIAQFTREVKFSGDSQVKLLDQALLLLNGETDPPSGIVYNYLVQIQGTFFIVTLLGHSVLEYESKIGNVCWLSTVGWLTYFSPFSRINDGCLFSLWNRLLRRPFLSPEESAALDQLIAALRELETQNFQKTNSVTANMSPD